MNDRAAPRRAAKDCPWITGLRLFPGGEAALLNISWSGLLAKCSKRLLPGTAVSMAMTGTLTPSVIKGRVARCEVGGIGKDGSIHYKVGIVFDEPVSLPDEDQALAQIVEAAPEQSEPIVENRW